ncbi:TetR/AcrR family transcriptional regulator [Nocardioides sp. KR10-350]|uniref:TetR/AcrR family transcriptional regulator n=1 Tax=Nocardioides cheoyonin TaxID=3156615 RepID=UPI0032B3FC0F
MDGRARRWQQHNDARRRRIVQAAIELIEAEGPDVTLQAIGEQAGLSRSVVYRHFADRRELDVAVQIHVLEGLWAQLLPAVELRGTVRETIERAIRVYVTWSVEHPRLHRLADYDVASDGNGPLQRGLEMVAARISEVIVAAFQLLGADVSEADRASADPLVFGLVGMVFSTVRRWVHLGEKYPDADAMVDLLTESVWALLEARGRAYGLSLDPDRPLDELLS